MKRDFENEFMTIKEFAGFAGMTESSLRHYDSKDIFVPAKRGVKYNNKYRYYAPTQITLVKMIRVLTEIGVPLKTIKDLAQDRSPEKLIKLLSRNKEMVADEVRFLQDVYSVIDTFLDLINEGLSITETDISISEMPEKQLILGRLNDFSEYTAFYGEFIHFYNTPCEPKLNPSYPIGAYWTSMAAFLDSPSQPMRFFSYDPKGNDQKSSGLYMNGYTRGYYGQTNDLPMRMEAFAKKNQLVFSGPVYNIYLFDEISISNPELYLLQVSAAVSETRRMPSRRPRRHL